MGLQGTQKKFWLPGVADLQCSGRITDARQCFSERRATIMRLNRKMVPDETQQRGTQRFKPPEMECYNVPFHGRKAWACPSLSPVGGYRPPTVMIGLFIR